MIMSNVKVLLLVMNPQKKKNYNQWASVSSYSSFGFAAHFLYGSALSSTQADFFRNKL